MKITVFYSITLHPFLVTIPMQNPGPAAQHSTSQVCWICWTDPSEVCHFCKECLIDFIEKSPEVTEVKCSDECGCTLSDETLRSVLPSPLYEAFVKRSIADDSVVIPTHQTLRQSLEEQLNCSCPNCGEVFFDFDGCVALTCRKCKKTFCGFDCRSHLGNGLDSSGEDPTHRHVRECRLNCRNPGSVFASERNIWKAQREAKARRIYRDWYYKYTRGQVSPKEMEDVKSSPVLQGVLKLCCGKGCGVSTIHSMLSRAVWDLSQVTPISERTFRKQFGKYCMQCRECEGCRTFLPNRLLKMGRTECDKCFIPQEPIDV